MSMDLAHFEEGESSLMSMVSALRLVGLCLISLASLSVEQP